MTRSDSTAMGASPLGAGQDQPDAVLGGLDALERTSGDDLDRGLERLLQVPRRARAEVPLHDLGSPPGRHEAEEIGCVAARARAPLGAEAGAGLAQLCCRALRRPPGGEEKRTEGVRATSRLRAPARASQTARLTADAPAPITVTCWPSKRERSR